jgi:hypothetical protein
MSKQNYARPFPAKYTANISKTKAATGIKPQASHILGNHFTHCSIADVIEKQEFVTELPTYPASGKFYVRQFQKIEV